MIAKIFIVLIYLLFLAAVASVTMFVTSLLLFWWTPHFLAVSIIAATITVIVVHREMIEMYLKNVSTP